MTRALISLLLSLVPVAASAYDILPEYQGLNEAEHARMERPSDLDAEYQSVIDSYLPRFEWETVWPRMKRGYETTVGSITNQHFLVYSRAKLDVDLEENLKFRLVYFEQRDREVDQVRHFVELDYRVSPRLAVAAYGEPSHFKRSNDIGVALIVSPSAHWDNRFYYTQHDFTRSAHNDEPDVFVGEDPMSIGWTGIFDDGVTFVRGGGRYDRPIAWNLPQETRLYRYEKSLIFGDWGWHLDTDEAIGARIQYDSTFESQIPVGASTVVEESWKRNRLIATIFHSRGTDGDEIRWEYALSHASRAWTDGLGRTVMHENLLPGMTARIRTVRRANGFDHAQVNLQATDFKTFGDVSLTTVTQSHRTTQARSQLAYEWSFSNGATLMLAGNFDLDEWITLPTFEGGNAQFKTEF